jgi:hypothetical protein
MPNLNGTPALDVLIGLSFLFFLLSVVCSSVNEAIAVAVRLRARTLETGIRSLLLSPGATQNFYEHWRVDALIKPASGPVSRLTARLFGARKPSYIPSRVFSLTLLDTFAPPDDPTQSLDLLQQAKKAVEGDLPAAKDLPPELRGLSKRVLVALSRFDPHDRLAGQAAKVLRQKELPDAVRGMIEDALDDAQGDVARFRASVERSFDEVMDRASGWYKRRVQLILFVIAVVLAAVINVDSFAIGQRLWKDEALRSAVVAQASKTGTCAAGNSGATTTTQAPGTEPQQTPVQKAAACVDEVKKLGLPLGWSGAPTGWGIPGKIIGLLITAFALTLGAPFWFDLLGKVARLRGSGPASDATPAGASGTS